VNKGLGRSSICWRDWGKLQKPLSHLNHTDPEHQTGALYGLCCGWYFFIGCLVHKNISFIHQFWWDILTLTLNCV
jgi:hypothetical protein